ncbi:MAG: hypothetical protein J5808_05300 [Paludibacteraceae bacterium]|nr:hypothetical protein [Paludibacteraceae bacterium]
MKKKLILLSGVLLLASSPSFADSQLTHAAGIHSVQVHGGCSVGNTWDAGLDYQYRFHKNWALDIPVDYEWGTFNRSDFGGFRLSPGAETSVWQICSWLYLNLNARMVLGYDIWKNPDMQAVDKGFALGASAGFNLEFFAIPELSVTLAASQSWKYTWLTSGPYNYFSPLFTVGFKYNIR